jgi:DNA-binding NarL/FixJ family response regulator
LTHLSADFVEWPYGAGQQEHYLTARDLSVLKLIALGLTDKEIAQRLRLSRRTVSNRASCIFLKLHVCSRTAAATQALACGIIKIDDAILSPGRERATPALVRPFLRG